MRPANLLISIVILIFCFNIQSIAQQQDTAKLYQITTVDGNVFVGKILSKDEKQIVFKTENLGTLNILFKNVKDLKEVSLQNLVAGEIWPENPHSSRYFYLPNGYGLKKGEGYYQNTWVLFNQLSYGFTDNFSMGVGLIPTFLFGVKGAPVWITPKLSFPVKKDKLNLGVGAIMGTYVGANSEDAPLLGMVYGVSTFGSADRNFTTGAGFAFADDEWASTPVFSLGGTIRTGKRHYFLSENYFFFGDGRMGSFVWLGGRFASRNLAIDYGGIIPVFPEMGRLIVIPWLSLTVPFGNKQKGYLPK